jgi:hypothetical protein
MITMPVKCKWLLITALLLLVQTATIAQSLKGFTWWNPFQNKFKVIEGVIGDGNIKGVGKYLKFNTNATDIVIRYVIKTDKPLPAKPTGATGISLYAITHDGKWVDVPGDFSFSDTITCRFNHLEIDKAYAGKDVEYRLFLPISNTLSQLEIGVSADCIFTPQPLQPERPIIVYSNTIMPNTTISAPGMTWTAQLERKLDRPLISLEIPQYIKQTAYTEAAIYMLDWDFSGNGKLNDKQVSVKLKALIQKLHQTDPRVPVLLLQRAHGKETGKTNELIQRAFAEFKASGIQNIYQLTAADIGAGIHTLSDTGMQQYATACEKMIRAILHQQLGQTTTTIPIIQSRDGLYIWRKRHAEELALIKEKPPANIILANSIIHYWGGKPQGPFSRGADSWNQFLEPLGVQNMGFGWDRIENVLWRIYHDELDGFTAKHVVLMIGTNNLSVNTDEEIIAGLKQLVEAVKQRQPRAQILLSGIFPRRNMEVRVKQLNKTMEQMAGQSGALFINPGKLLLNEQGKVDESLFGDGLHPNVAGYQKIAPVLSGYLKN